MAYRRKHGMARASTFSVSSSSEFHSHSDDSPSSSLAAQAIRASSAHRDSSLSSAYGESAYRESTRLRSSTSKQDGSPTYEYTSMRSLDESKYGFWGVLARKAKSILEDDNIAKQFETPTRFLRSQNLASDSHFHQSEKSIDGTKKPGSPKFQKRLDAITSSLNYIGGTIGNALEEGFNIVENRAADVISETRGKLQIRRRGQTNTSDMIDAQASDVVGQRQPAQMTQQTDQETQLKASRDVAMAMAAKAKLLLRELKTVKADLAFSKARCAQLEEENRILRESRGKGDSAEDDDMIRLQLETLLAEKARLAHENSIYARENRFLREIVDYHQLTMQDVVYVDEGQEEVTEVYPIPMPSTPMDAQPVVPIPPHEAEASSPTSSNDALSPVPTPVVGSRVSDGSVSEALISDLVAQVDTSALFEDMEKESTLASTS